MLRKAGVYPYETAWAFKNIYNTYDSLISIGEPRFGPQKVSYGAVAQAFLSSVTRASSFESRDFSPYKRPDQALVEGHAGKFVAGVSKINLLTRFSLFLRHNFKGFETRLQTPRFEEILKKYEKLDFEAIRSFTSSLLNSPEFELVAEDVIYVFYNLAKDERKKLANISLELLEKIISLEKQDFKALLEIGTAFVNNYASIKEIWRDSLTWEEKRFLLKKAPLLLNQKVLSGLLGDVKQEAISLLGDMNFHLKAKRFLEDIEFKNDDGDAPNMLIEILDDKSLTIEPVLQMIRSVKEKDGNLRYFANICRLLSAKEGSSSFLRIGLEELFLKKERLTVSFLKDLFSKFRLVEDTTPLLSE